MLEKQKLILEDKKLVHLDFEKNDILVKPYLSITDKVLILKTYIDNFFKEDNLVESYLMAEYAIVLSVIDLCTNISIEDADVNNFISSGLWAKIHPLIENYAELEIDIFNVIKYMREDIALEKSVGNVIDNTSAKIIELVNNLSKIDVSKEGLDKILNQINKNIDSLSPSDILETKTTKKRATKNQN